MSNLLNSIRINNKPGKDVPIYEQIAVQIKEKIQTSVVSSGDRLPSISEMMKTWNLGYPTIKTALDLLEGEQLIRCEPGRGKGPVVLGKHADEKVLTFGFHRWCNEAQFLNLEKGIRQGIEERQWNLKVIDSTMLNRHFDSDVLLAESEQLDGMIFYPMDRDDYLAVVKKIMSNGVSVVFVDRYFPELDVSSVCIDNFSGGYEATSHLIQEHDCPVHYFGNISRPSSSHLRHQGWYQAMREHFCNNTIPINDYVWELPLQEGDTTVMDPSRWEAPVYESSLKYIKSVSSDKICVFCVNDDAARIMSDAARDLKWEVGKNFFIVGFGDKPYCERLPVPLTSVAQYDEKVGYEAFRLMSEIVDNPSLSLCRINRMVSADLKIRSSSRSK